MKYCITKDKNMRVAELSPNEGRSECSQITMNPTIDYAICSPLDVQKDIYYTMCVLEKNSLWFLQPEIGVLF